ncbi:pilus assembly protein PapC [Pseudomonas sp. C2L11]|uniref:Pilus assembly protein PapC n=1 Tax=Pseudomonas typographi TaxID=2715964 RepID=A0ABR7Z7P5_9PSED|nr:pilus assembly protein PapC [Pseudomonas typographi]MBD1601546.1 pilus assembly protein PapC [Pseudomonas typographi]
MPPTVVGWKHRSVPPRAPTTRAITGATCTSRSKPPRLEYPAGSRGPAVIYFRKITVFAIHPLRLALACAAGVACFGAHAGPVGTAPLPSLLAQAETLPAEFRDHFFDVPLAARVDLNGRYLADALLILGRDNTVQLLKYTATAESEVPLQTRELWLGALASPQPLGDCGKGCANELLALHYSLERSTLTLVTHSAEADSAPARYHSLPQGGGGLLLRNRLNVAGSESQMYGSLVSSGNASLGTWSGVSEMQLDRNQTRYQRNDLYRMRSLYADRVSEGRFFRLGYFTPSVQGLSRQPRTLLSLPEGTLGAMYGSSDTLAIDSDQPSATPIYVTPNRPATVEVYRNGSLVYSQPVQPGLQTLDTRKLPGGIYSVEVRVLEDGQVTSSSEEFVYKPTQWRDLNQRWRYNVYAGKNQELLSNWEYQRDDGFNAGVIANYLLHPQAILGLSAEHLEGSMQYGMSLDWTLHDGLRTYANLYRTQGRGDGLDVQAIYSYKGGNLIASHSRSWMYWRTQDERTPAFFTPRYRRVIQQTEQTSLSWQHQVTSSGTLTGRMTYDQGAQTGAGGDVSWIQRSRMFSTDSTWTFSVFDRPGGYSSGAQRDRGVDLSLSLSLGGSGDSLYGSIGSRTSRDGHREQTASVNYQHPVNGPFLSSVTGLVNHDSYGTGVGGRAAFQNRWVAGDGYLQTSSYNGEVGGGLNLNNLVAFGGGRAASTGDLTDYKAGMVVDVASEVDGIELATFDDGGAIGRLHPGRNLIPLTPYRPGRLRVNVRGEEAEPVALAPQVVSYHVNRGAVAYQKIFVRRTLTVIGRLMDEHGKPISGAMVINHASRSVSESDGFFAVEMSESTPVLDVRQGKRRCLVTVNTEHAERDNNVLLVGDLVCQPREVAARPQAARVGRE